MVFGRGCDIRSCRDDRVVLRRRFPECLNRRRHRERPGSPTRRRHWHASLLSGHGRSRCWLSRYGRRCRRRRVARDPGRTAGDVACPNRRLRGTRLRWRLLRRLRRGGRGSSRGGQASGRALGGRSALAASRPRRLGSRPLLQRGTSLWRAATRGRGRSAGLPCRLGLSTPRLRRRRRWRCGLRVRRLSGWGGRRRCLLYGWSGRAALNLVGLLSKPQPSEKRLPGLWRRWRIPNGYRARGFRARSWRAVTGWTTRSRRTGLGWRDRAGRLTGRFGRRLLLGWLCLLIRRLLIRRLLTRRLLWLRRAPTCRSTGSRAARLRWTNRRSGNLRSPAATSNSCATCTRRCDLLFAGALPVGTLVLLVRSLPGWTSTWSGRWLSI